MARPPHSPLANAERHTNDTERHTTNTFNVLFQPAKKPDQNPKEKGTKSGENQVQFKINL